ncbi:MAG: hypothetical protein P8Q97_02755, partial [Myxococcota bacterium]|nr:hypothetical protein [Myxococcota bacterium]
MKKARGAPHALIKFALQISRTSKPAQMRPSPDSARRLTGLPAITRDIFPTIRLTPARAITYERARVP